MERRGFLKLFGVGASVVPIVGGVLIPDAEARIIEPPKVELVKTAALPSPVDIPPLKAGTRGRAVFSFETEGRTQTFECESFIVDVSVEPIETTEFGREWRTFMPGRTTLSWKVTGLVTGSLEFGDA